MYSKHCSKQGSLVRPKVVRSVHYCNATKTVMERAYTDFTSFEAFPQSAVYPTTVIIYNQSDNSKVNTLCDIFNFLNIG